VEICNPCPQTFLLPISPTAVEVGTIDRADRREADTDAESDILNASILIVGDLGSIGSVSDL